MWTLVVGALGGCDGAASSRDDVGALCTEMSSHSAQAARHRDSAVAALDAALHGWAIAQKEAQSAAKAEVAPKPEWWRPAWTDAGASQAWCQASRDGSATVARLAQQVAQKTGRGTTALIDQPPPSFCTDPNPSKQLAKGGAESLAQMKTWAKAQDAAAEAAVDACRKAAAKAR